MSANSMPHSKKDKKITRLYFPVEFTYKTEYKKYKNMGNSRFEGKDWYCRNYVTWRKNFKATYHTINTEEDRLQLERAFRDHQKNESLWRNALTSILLAILILIAPYIIQFVLREAATPLPKEYSVEINIDSEEDKGSDLSLIGGKYNVVESDSSNYSPKTEFFVTLFFVVFIETIMARCYGNSIGQYRFDQEALRTIELIKSGKENINDDEDNDE